MFPRVNPDNIGVQEVSDTGTELVFLGDDDGDNLNQANSISEKYVLNP